MHPPDPSSPLPPSNNGTPWWKELSSYHWFVLAVAALGWLFDTMDQQLFNLARKPALTELLGAEATKAEIDRAGAYATSIFIMGWAMGGLIFGILGDKWGRAKTMLLTILIYSIFTGISALSVGYWDFVLWRFLTGLGVGGEFAVGVALVAEVMPDRARPHALGWLQALSAVGNITAALITVGLGSVESEGTVLGWSTWRIMFAIGTAPALLAILIRWRLKEPERWQAIAAEEKIREQLGSLAEMFGNPRWRKHALIGLALAFSGVVGLWGIGFFIFDFIRVLFVDHLEASALTRLVGITGILLNVGAFFGIYAFSRITHVLGRKPTFAIFFVLAILSTAMTFWFLEEIWHIYLFVPILGFCQLALFGGYAIYFPELFPTALRSTGTSFCYNVGRFVAAVGPLTLGLLTSEVYGGFSREMAWRFSGLTMCAFFLIGLFALPWAPETRGQPLPE